MTISTSVCSLASLLIFYNNAFPASAQSECTTVQPVFLFPTDGTSTVFASTTTATNVVDCNGCSLVVSTFQAIVNLLASNTSTLSVPTTTSSSFICAPSTSSPSPTTPISIPTGISATPTASPLPPINGTAGTLISNLQTALLYAALIGNDGNLPKLCSVIGPAALSNITGINGTAVQNQVCAAASLDVFDPAFAEAVVLANQVGLGYLFTALYAVEVAGGFAGGTDLSKLCTEIEATLIDNIFINFTPRVGTAVKNFVCSKANQTVATPSSQANVEIGKFEVTGLMTSQFDWMDLPGWEYLDLSQLHTFKSDPSLSEADEVVGTRPGDAVAVVQKKCSGSLEEFILEGDYPMQWPIDEVIDLPKFKRITIHRGPVHPGNFKNWMAEMPTLESLELCGTFVCNEYHHWLDIFDGIRNHPKPIQVSFDHIITNEWGDLSIEHPTDDFQKYLAMGKSEDLWDEMTRSLCLYLSGKIGHNRSLRYWLADKEQEEEEATEQEEEDGEDDEDDGDENEHSGSDPPKNGVESDE